MRSLLCLLCSLLMAGMAVAQQQTSTPDWTALSFLLGDWDAGSGAGVPGTANNGGASFRLDLEKQVMLRRAFSDYPAHDGKPASHHEDLMVIHPLPGGEFAAEYYDSEGHVIHYQVSVDRARSAAVFLSHATESSPGFRLTYKKNDNKLDGLFEISPPGKTDRFSEYLRWNSSRK